MDLQVEGKVFMIAASSKGMGFGIARELAKNGAIVCMASRTKADVEKAAEQLRNETGSTIHASVFDAASAESINQWIKEVETAFERIDGLLVNAGGPPAGDFDDFTDDDWQTCIQPYINEHCPVNSWRFTGYEKRRWRFNINDYFLVSKRAY